MSTTAEVTLTNEVGLHARPAAILVKQASGYSSSITLRRDDEVADATSLLQVLTLEASQGTTIVIEADGEDEEVAVSELVELLRSF